jgi:hypothetical protein
VIRRSIVHEFEFESGLREYFQGIERADEEIREWGERVAKWPDMGYAVHGAPDYLGIPLHTSHGSFLIIYWYDDDHIYCIGMRPIPSIVGDYYDLN